MNLDTNQYSKEGYCVFENVFSSLEMKKYQSVLNGMVRRLQPSEKPQFMFEPHVGSRHWKFWLQLARHPKILDRVESVLGPNLILILSHFIIKGTQDKMKVGWHQDQRYWTKGVLGDDLCTVWMPFVKVNKKNGCMKVIPKSNQSFIRKDATVLDDDGITITRFEVAVNKDIEKTAVDIEINPGSFSIHDGFIIHGSEPNLTKRMRKIYTIRYANSFTTKFVPQNWNIPFFLVRGEAPEEKFYIDLRPDKSLPMKQPKCLLVDNIRSGIDKRIPRYY